VSDSTYFRFNSEKCLRLARKTEDMRIAAELIEMAEDFAEKAERISARETLQPQTAQMDGRV
jgi:hypothetical protein